jgi:hypothetical protein
MSLGRAVGQWQSPMGSAPSPTVHILLMTIVASSIMLVYCSHPLCACCLCRVLGICHALSPNVCACNVSRGHKKKKGAKQRWELDDSLAFSACPARGSCVRVEPPICVSLASDSSARIIKTFAQNVASMQGGQLLTSRRSGEVHIGLPQLFNLLTLGPCLSLLLCHSEGITAPLASIVG